MLPTFIAIVMEILLVARDPCADWHLTEVSDSQVVTSFAVGLVRIFEEYVTDARFAA